MQFRKLPTILPTNYQGQNSLNVSLDTFNDVINDEAPEDVDPSCFLVENFVLEINVFQTNDKIDVDYAYWEHQFMKE